MLICLSLEYMQVDRRGSSVNTAASIDQALKLTDAHAFDAAMLEMNLSGTSRRVVAEARAMRAAPSPHANP